MEKRLVLALVLCFGVMMLTQVLFPPPEPEEEETATETTEGTAQAPVKGTNSAAPAVEIETAEPATAGTAGLPEFEADTDIVFDTENLRLAFTTEGGALREAWVKKYEVRAGVEPDRQEHWYRILREDLTQNEVRIGDGTRDERRIHRTGSVLLLGAEGAEALPTDRVSWKVAERDPEAGKLVFELPLPNGLTLRKTWMIESGEDCYHLDLTVDVLNRAGSTVPVGLKRRLQINGPVGLVSDVGDGSRVVEKPVTGFAGIGQYDLDEVLARTGFVKKATEDEPFEGGAWVGLGNLFFASALLPDASTPASEIRLWVTHARDAVEGLEEELRLAEKARGLSGPKARGSRRYMVTSEELKGFSVVTAPSCGGCGGSQRTPEINGIQEEIGRQLTTAELKGLAGDSFATCLRFDFEVPAGGTMLPVFKGKLFLGPKAKSILSLPAYEVLAQTRDLGWFSWLGEVLLWILGALYGLVGNYGVAIILLTLIVRGAMFPLSRHQQVSMQRYGKDMARVKPKLDKLKEKFKDNPKKMNAEMMKMYKAEGVSMVPKGCLVMFLQIPIFIGLFGALRAAIELRHAPFLWVADLTGPDHLFHMPFFKNVPLLPEWFNLFPITMTILWWLSAKMAPKPADPQQQQTAKMMQYMPLIFGVMLYKYQAGLAIYMTISSLWSIIETRMVRRFLAKQDEDASGGLRPVISKG